MSGDKSHSFRTITVKELHPTFGAEIHGADFENMTDAQLQEIKAAMAKYGVLVFRATNLTDDTHVAFSARIGALDNIKRFLTNGRKMRYTHYELFDAGNVDEQGNPIDPTAPRSHYNKGNLLFHTDSSFNPRRASWSLLHAVKLPPPGTGGETEFADSRTAWDELDEGIKRRIEEGGYVGAHTLLHSRKLGSPDYFKDLDPWSEGMARHKVLQVHEPSGRQTLYLGAHCHHLERLSGDGAGRGVEVEESEELLEMLKKHMTQQKYVLRVDWLSEGDLVAWDNTSVLHRATGGKFEGNYVRDMRRTTVHDDSSTAWGYNDGQEARGFNLQGVLGGTKSETRKEIVA
ncbi:taurine catabolism dioxygenase [Periconia macrospinosa]|uniref:Taurine catabolism dioxygenase n=1 Tax=Periconia macrospinosa TaxID=97972 RepID=A0A2V1EBZ6_9PLEO|nr:taurine catabolism dioxygenase [Periconia macrospinosa]